MTTFQKGYIVEIEKSTCLFETDQPRKWYLLHQPVIHSNKPGHVGRIRNNELNFMAFRSSNALLTGSDFQQNLVHVLLRFWKDPYSASAEV